MGKLFPSNACLSIAEFLITLYFKHSHV